MKKRTFVLVVTVLICLLFLSPGLSLSAPYYEGKTINIIVGYAAGGGYDRMARLLAKHLPKHIPGNPTILVQNMPGADSMISANHVYNVAKPDGLTLGAFNRGLPYAQLLKAEGVKFDLTHFSWIGSAAVEGTVLALRTDLPYKTVEDLFKAKSEIILGNTGPADSSGQFPVLLQEYCKFNFKMISYPSSADVMLAVERKELDGRGASFSSVKPFIDRGLVLPLIRGRISQPGIEKLPVDEDLAKEARGKTIMAMRSAVDGIGRPYVAPPGTPAEVMNILKDAFAKVAKDPEAAEDAKKMKMDVDYVPAEECVKVVRDLLAQPEEIVKEFSKFIKF